MKIEGISVKGLFGIFDHKMNFNMKTGITAILGPNGYGKTILLKFLYSLLKKDPDYGIFLKIPFKEFKIDFDTKKSILVSKDAEIQIRISLLKFNVEVQSFEPKQEQLEIPAPDAADIARFMNLGLDSENVRNLSNYIVHQSPSLDNRLSLFLTEAFGTREIGSYGSGTYHYLKSIMGKKKTRQAYIDKPWLSELKNLLKIRLFDVDRLNSEDLNNFILGLFKINVKQEKRLLVIVDGPSSRGGAGEDRLNMVLLAKFAHKVDPEAQLFYISKGEPTTKGEYAALGFETITSDDDIDVLIAHIMKSKLVVKNPPSIIILASRDATYGDIIKQIRKDFGVHFLLAVSSRKNLSSQILRLFNIEDILVFPFAEPLLNPELTNFIKKQTEMKRVSNNIQEYFTDRFPKKLELLKETINLRFLFKEMDFSMPDGFYFRTKTGLNISPSDLSSGERQLWYLYTELALINEPGTLVIIDEPELSLHISWQLSFLEDLLTFQKDGHFEILIATHSPVIIGDRWDLVQELDVDEEQEE